jgi:signal transduction histidine kinase
MAIIKSIIEQHGGSIVIESELGKGTKVMLYLPVAVS